MCLLLVLASLLFTLPAHAVTIEWVTVSDPGNPADTEVMYNDGTTGYGSVAYTYLIGKYEVTNAQYAEFLDAVAATDTYGLYFWNMGSSSSGGITRSGSPGSYSYSAIAGRESWPVTFVSFHNALRFANWLHNGQPTGAQDNTTTEDGAYAITAQGIADNSITRNPEARVFLTSEDEWYKAAYFDPSSVSFFDYPTGTDLEPTCAAPGPIENTANCDDVVGAPTVVGSYSGSTSPYGTFDQGGNVFEWTEAIREITRIVRAGSVAAPTANLRASSRASAWAASGSGTYDMGFRVAMIPEFSTAQQSCVNAMNENVAKVNWAQLKEHETCLKGFQKGKLGSLTFELCITEDRMDRVAKAQARTETQEAKKCGPLVVAPPFAYTDSATVNAAATDAAFALIDALFGNPVQDADLGTEASGNGRARCQLEMLKQVNRLENTILKEVSKAKKTAIKDDATNTREALGARLQPVFSWNPWITKAQEKLVTGVEKKCGALPDPGAAFPGSCADLDLGVIEDCAIATARCQACLTMSTVDNLMLDCDGADDGDAGNASCL